MSDSPTDNMTFEHALAGLEQAVRQMEDGQLGLEEALACYERGIGLLKRCYTQLREAEQRIVLLTGVDGEGQPVTQPFTHPAAVEEANKPDPKRRRRKPEDGPEIPF